MRVHCLVRPRPGRSRALEIRGLRTSVRVMARVVWSRRVGILTHHVGVLFEEVSPTAWRGLLEIARSLPPPTMGSFTPVPGTAPTAEPG